uniref:Uncharacterized protein n=1 Tax=Oryza glumipatula TaxID=40148 RepID=A0A0E0BD82_9ORYZ
MARYTICSDPSSTVFTLIQRAVSFVFAPGNAIAKGHDRLQEATIGEEQSRNKSGSQSTDNSSLVSSWRSQQMPS